jgi:hypothetical protein
MLSLFIVALSVAGGAPLLLQPAGDKVITTERAKPLVDAVSRDGDGIAIGGYDAVAYFEVARPVKGSRSFEHEYKGAVWRFSSSQHREMFAREPDRFMPQFGGYCAYAVARGYTATASPLAWSIADGKLYLNYNEAVRKVWQSDQERLIDGALHNWPRLHRGPR